MIFTRQLSAIFLICEIYATISDDFKFDSDDMQEIIYSDLTEAVIEPQPRSLYAQEIAHCPIGESKMTLTLFLQSLRWSDVSESKREKAIEKLSRFFLVPKQFITVGDIYSLDILKMLKHSINKSNNLLNTKDAIGRIEFMIGCGEEMFTNGKQIALQIDEKIKDGTLNELSGTTIGWWNIWTKHDHDQRRKRQAEGSGNNQEYDDDEYADETSGDFSGDNKSNGDQDENEVRITEQTTTTNDEVLLKEDEKNDEVNAEPSSTSPAAIDATSNAEFTTDGAYTSTEIIATSMKNLGPLVPNPLGELDAYIGQLFVFEVPRDTFYDPEDKADLKLMLFNNERAKLDPNHWLRLRFDPENRELFGVPTFNDTDQQYNLVAQDKQGLETNDAFIVKINRGNFSHDYSASFEYQIDMAEEEFNKADHKRKFIEAIAEVFHDSNTDNILLKTIKSSNSLRNATSVVLQNTTLLNEIECPTVKIENLRNLLLRQDKTVRDEVKKTMLRSGLPISQISVSFTKSCQVEVLDDQDTPIINQDVLTSNVASFAIVVLMLLIAIIITSALIKRRKTGKIVLGDVQERKNTEDVLEEKLETLTESPVILEDEKPTLLPQHGLSQDGGDEDKISKDSTTVTMVNDGQH